MRRRQFTTGLVWAGGWAAGGGVIGPAWALCLFFSTILISHYPSIILNAGKKLYWMSFFL